MARRVKPSLSPDLLADLPVFERRLDNGLTALVLPRRGSPVVVVDLYYPVGSFDEPPGLSGLAHFVEHMLFKGTERYPKGQIDRLVTAAAGQCNAETGEDSTHYWFTFPCERWDLALAIEADRMCHARFDPREVDLERRVINEERARELNSPQGRLDQNHLAVSYLRHPYRNPILGWPEDAARIGVEDLTRFYRQHYRPDGAVLVVVGGGEGDRVLDRISKVFEGIPKGAGPRTPRMAAEPRQSGRRDFALREPDGVARGSWAGGPCRGAIPTSPRWTSFPTSFLAAGGRGSGRRWSRIRPWRRGSRPCTRRLSGAGQFLVQVETESEGLRSAIEHCVLDELRRMADAGPTPEELARSRCRLDAARRWERDDPASLATGLGHAALWGDWRTWPAEQRAAMSVDRREHPSRRRHSPRRDRLDGRLERAAFP